MNLLTCFSHMYPGWPKYRFAWQGMLLYFPFGSISPQFSFPKLFGSCLFQRHVPGDVSLTQAVFPLNQHHVWEPSTLFKPMNQRVFFRLCFMVKFLTKCHSFSVSIETSKPFSGSLHFSPAVFQSFISPWKEYLEQTIPDVHGKPNDKWKRQLKKNNRFTYLLLVLIVQDLEEATQKKN